MRAQSQPRRIRDGPRVVLGAVGALTWLGSVALLIGSVTGLVRTPIDWVRRDGTTLRDVGLAVLLVPLAVLGFVLATLLVPLFLIRGARSLRALLRERRRALELRRVGREAAQQRAIFVSYRTAHHVADAQAIARVLQAADDPAWLDSEHGTLPTQLFFVDRVLEDAVRSARAVVILHDAEGDAPYEESRLDRIDRALATALRWAVFAPLAVFAGMLALLAWPLAPLLAASEPKLARKRWIVPPSLRARWYRSLCGIAVERRPDERWQAWEQRLAWLYGLPTVGVAVVADAPAAPAGADVILRRSAIEDDVRAVLVPRLAAAHPDPTAPLALLAAQITAARAALRTRPYRTLWHALSGEGLAARLRKMAGESGAAEAFARGGYAALGRFLDAREVADLREQVERVLAAPSGESCERPHNTLVPLRWDDAPVEHVLRDEARMRRLAAVTDGDDLRWISGYLSLKEPHSPALWWHQDWWCWDHSISYEPRAAQVALLVYLSATDEETAALRVLPRSHHERTDLHAALPEAHSARAGDLDAAMADHPDQVTLALSAGDAIVLDYRLLHGTHPNRADQRRDCVLMTFAPSWRSLPAEIRGHLIQHPALPRDDEIASAEWASRLLPGYDGPRADLPLNRDAYSTRIAGPESPEKITR